MLVRAKATLACFTVVVGNCVTVIVVVCRDCAEQLRWTEEEGWEVTVAMLLGVKIGGNQRSRGMRGSKV